jgi:hypothetical protein
MSISRKYGRTYHYPFSPGTTSDDRIHHDYWSDVNKLKTIVHTEKLDGENNCLSRYGVFARSHASPTVSAWTKEIRQRWELIRNDLGDIEIFGENLYAIHSIEYRKLEHHYYVFAVRMHDVWLSWEEVKFYAAMLDLPTVPQIEIESTPIDRKLFEQKITNIVATTGAFEPVDTATGRLCTLEGIVSRNAAGFHRDDFAHNVFKWVRKGHVKTNEHWTRNWKRAGLKHEGG